MRSDLPDLNARSTEQTARSQARMITSRGADRLSRRLAVWRTPPARLAGALALAALVTSDAANAQQPVVRSPLSVSLPGSTPTSSVALGVDGDVVAALFIANDPGGTGRSVQISLSSDAGLSFGPPVVVDGDTSSASDTVVPSSCVVLGSTIYAAWLDHRIAGGAGVYFTRSLDGGLSFEPERRLSDGYPGTAMITAWDFAVTADAGGDDVHVLFAARAPGASVDELFELSSDDGGSTFNAPRLVFGAAGSGVDVESVALAADGKMIHVAWDDDSQGSGSRAVWYRRSSDGGLTFPLARRELFVTDVSGARNAYLKAIDYSGSRLAVLFQATDAGSGLNSELRGTLSSDAGASFATDFGFLPGADDGALAVEADHLLAIGISSGLVEAAVTADDGASFQTTTLGSGSDLALASDADRHVATWISTDSVPIVEAAFSLDAALTWSSPLSLTDGQDDVAALQGLVCLEPTRSNVIALSGQAPPASGTEWLAALGFSIAGGASTTTRNAGTNPDSLTADLPVFGKLWTARVDVGSTGHALAGLIGAFGPTTLPLPGGQTLLANIFDPSGELLGQPLKVGPNAFFVVSIPNDPRLAGVQVSIQGLHVGAQSPFLLSNAIDMTLGAF